ncbi:major facilitator superfamily domain-containing protein [Penicillium cataractarum]|uniref:Major facilitator superfamily domain-containing protein n=1 Tax=Penicillium cataractarum TaxID=2100454 RepID=A0A9W9RGG1_9EURO|nr:major facilitator superfamily domain-containing protein [Penicillium cataractarum]KAJ5358814.1 major facilitator superfamily domain-containing protein [Penicillium cataractarum]
MTGIKNDHVGHPTMQSELEKITYAMKDPEAAQDVQVEESQEFLEYTEEESKRVKRKIDFILLPLLCLCYVFSFLDKTLLNYSSIFGIKEALHLKGTDYSWLGSAFYLGYMAGSVLWAKLVQRWPMHAGKFISGAVFTWSCITLLTPLCYNFAGILVVRLFLGMVESIIGPVFVIVTSNWWTRPEQAFRTAFWLGGTPIGNFFGGLISYGLGSMDSALPTWKLFFVFFGALSFGFAFVLIIFMPDNQSNARWLNEREKKIALERVRENQTVSSNNDWKWNQFWEALRDPQTTLFFITAVGNTMPSTFASQFSSQIVKGFGFTTLQTTLVSTCPAAVIQLGTYLIFSSVASHHKDIRLALSMAVSVPPLIGASLLHSLPQSNQAGRLAGYYLTYTHAMSFTLNTGLMASNYAGNTKKSTANGIIFAGWAAGLVAGPQFFLDSEAPTYNLAFKMLMGCYALMIVIPIFQLSWYTYENKRRDRLVASKQDQSTSTRLEFVDKSDFERWETFRYTM